MHNAWEALLSELLLEEVTLLDKSKHTRILAHGGFLGLSRPAGAQGSLRHPAAHRVIFSRHSLLELSRLCRRARRLLLPASKPQASYQQLSSVEKFGSLVNLCYICMLLC